MEIREATISPIALKNREAEIIILESGPGSKGRKCWYGDEAIESGKDIFRGAQVYGNHPSKSQMVDLPERSVKELVGRIKETYVVVGDNGKKQLRGVLKIMEGEDYDWVVSLIHESIQAKKEGFPPVAQVSIHADGDTEKRIMEGEEYNYVKNIKSAVSVDVVTRGGIKNSGFTKFIESYYGGNDMPQMDDRKRERLMGIQRKLDEALNTEDKKFLESLEGSEGSDESEGETLLETESGEQFEEVFAMEDGTFQTAQGDPVDPTEIHAADAEGNIYDPDQVADYGMEMAAAEASDSNEDEEDEEEEDDSDFADEGDEDSDEDEEEAEQHAGSRNRDVVPISELATRFPHVADEIDREEGNARESERDAEIVALKFKTKLMESRLIGEKKIIESGLPEGFIDIEDLLGKPASDMDRVIRQRRRMMESMVNLVESARPVVKSAASLRESEDTQVRGVGRRILRNAVMPTF